MLELGPSPGRPCTLLSALALPYTSVGTFCPLYTGFTEHVRNSPLIGPIQWANPGWSRPSRRIQTRTAGPSPGPQDLDPNPDSEPDSDPAQSRRSPATSHQPSPVQEGSSAQPRPDPATTPAPPKRLTHLAQVTRQPASRKGNHWAWTP